MRVFIKCLVLSLSLIEISSGSSFNYPKVERNESVIDDYFGTKVADPYRWLEDLDSEETKNFVREQNNLTYSYLNKATARDQIRETLSKLWKYPKVGLPKPRGKNFYLFKNSGLQNQWILYKGKTHDEVYSDEAKMFINPNNLSTDGTVALRKLSYSKDGEMMAYTIAKSGSDWNEIFIKNTTTDEDFPEVLTNTKFPSITWTHDNLGFFYTRYLPTDGTTKLATANKNQKVFYHRVGTSQEEDTLMIEFLDEPDWSVSVEMSDDGEYLVVTTYKVINEYYVFYTRITEDRETGFKKQLKLTQLVTKPALYSFNGNDGHIFYFMTNEGAPKYKFIGMDINNPGQKYWATLINEDTTPSSVLQWIQPIAKNFMLVSYTKDVKSTLELRNLANGTLIHEYELEAGSIQSTEGRREDNTFLFTLATFTNPGITYRLNFDNGKIPKELELYRKTAFSGLDTNEFVTNQVFYNSKDGTRVPMFLVHRKNFTRTGNAPTLLHGYGGFQSSSDPYFSVGYLAFVSMFNGVLAFPGIRGGGEYGTTWWDEGRLFKKQNVFDDFAAAAEYLIRENYTVSSKLAIQGASNGGLLVGACINQRPELFGAALAEVGVMDMLRFQKFTVGSFWCGEYGCSEDEAHFRNLIKYSPLHNIRNNTVYPAVLVYTADTDDRVVPSHSFKYISQLQYTVGNNKNQTQPLLIRVEEKAGHGAGKPTSKVIEEYVDTYSFLQLALDYKFTNA